jgi:hypothetical protein
VSDLEGLALQEQDSRYCYECGDPLTPDNRAVDGSWCEHCTHGQRPVVNRIVFPVSESSTVMRARAAARRWFGRRPAKEQQPEVTHAE